MYYHIEQTPPIGAVCSGSNLFASILKSVMLGNYLHEATLAGVIFQIIFSWRLKGLNN